MTADPTSPPPAATFPVSMGQLFSDVVTIRIGVQDLTNSVNAIIRRGDDHETRIRALERRMWIAIGASGFAGGAASAVITLWTARGH